MVVLEKFLNPIYLDSNYINRLKEDLKAKPNASYIILDNFFKPEILNNIINEASTMQYDPKADSTEVYDRKIMLPFDGAAVECDPDSILGELLYHKEWYHFIFNLLDMTPARTKPVIKMRYNDKQANGYWMHNDKVAKVPDWERFTTVLGYFNQDWQVSDGGMLQIWEESSIIDPNTPSYNYLEHIEGRLDMFNQTRINVWPYGAMWDTNENKDFILIDQILPSYNRIVIFNLNNKPIYHSVTPNNGKIRKGFIQWLYKQNEINHM